MRVREIEGKILRNFLHGGGGGKNWFEISGVRKIEGLKIFGVNYSGCDNPKQIIAVNECNELSV